MNTDPGFASNVKLIARREMIVRLRSKSFVITFVALLLSALLATIVPNIIAEPGPVKVAVSGQPTVDPATMLDPAGRQYFDVVKPGAGSSLAAAEQALRDGEVEAVLDFNTGGGAGVSVIGLRDVPARATQAFTAAPPVRLIAPDKRDPTTTYFVTFAFALLFFLAAQMFGSQIAQSVVEEKSTRIVEILLSTVSARMLLAGKILGNSLLAIVQIIAVAAAALIGLAATGSRVSIGDLGEPIVWFVVYFSFGFVMVASLYAATASLVSRSEEIASATSPVMMIVMIPYVLSFVATGSGDQTLLHVMAWVPVSAPIAMPSMLFEGSVAWWEPIGSVAVLVVSTASAIALGERLYRNALLRTGARVRLRDALRSV
jgi:ABC-2 type transport system permease protein